MRQMRRASADGRSPVRASARAVRARAAPRGAPRTRDAAGDAAPTRGGDAACHPVQRCSGCGEIDGAAGVHWRLPGVLRVSLLDVRALWRGARRLRVCRCSPRYGPLHERRGFPTRRHARATTRAAQQRTLMRCPARPTSTRRLARRDGERRLWWQSADGVMNQI